ncbi:MAG: dihydrodipicolinate synthase family protein [Spirochaetaceae bacterium]|nr:dihydrodipicolinate synthase family protein [Spirochaetaceae bacterium]
MNTDFSEFYGVIPAQITPCIKPGIPDPEGMINLSRILINHGCHGLFVLGSTGGLPLLDDDQRSELIAAAREGAGTGAVLYAGITGCGAKQAIRYAKVAEQSGADVGVVMVPFFLKITQEGGIDYIRQIADVSPIPIGIYNHLRMPTFLNGDSLKQLADHPNIVAIKDTDTDLKSSLDRLHLVSDSSVSFFQGREPYLYESFLAGADGCVSALANIAPELHRKLYDAVKNGKYDEAKACQGKIDSLSRLFQLEETKTSFAAFTYSLRKVLEIRGWINNTYGLMPGFNPNEGYNQKIHEIVDEAGLLSNHE